MWILLTALGLAAASGLPSVVLRRRAEVAARVGCAMMVVGAGLGLWRAVAMLAGGQGQEVWRAALPVGSVTLSLDALGAFFLVPICVVGAAGTMYGLGYWRAREHPRNERWVRLFYGWLVAAMGLTVLAADGIGFLAAYEIVSLTAFALISTENQRQGVRQAGWLYLVATHLSILALMGFLALWHAATGSFEMRALASGTVSPAVRSVLFGLALVAFGCKAGMMPLHFWLPDAHANAPSHVSAILSGVVIKMGIYGLVRFGFMLLPGPPLSWGVLVLLLGTTSAILGVAFALAQHDLKRLLAYHSVENIGIILMGLGVALIGAATGHPAWTALGLAGCLLHVWNHGLFKPLLFFAAGSVIHHTHTRRIDRMGGLAKVMPWTAGAFLLGAVAICGLPPLNGFVSEWLVYVGMLAPMMGAKVGAGGWGMMALGAPALAVVGALAVACFVKAYGVVFLGEARGKDERRKTKDERASMVVPMGVLGALCVVLGVFPAVGVAGAAAVVQAAHATEGTVSEALAPAGALNVWMPVVMGALLAGMAGAYAWLRGRKIAAAGTWDCGYAEPTARMQYTASGFATMLVDLFRWILRPEGTKVQLTRLFPGTVHFASHVGDVVLDGWLNPLWTGTKRLLVERRTQRQGAIQWYLVLICVAVVGLLLTLMPWEEVWQWVLTQG